MYSTGTGLVLGFHGTDASIASKILSENTLKYKQNKYDWLGHGAYFWENSPSRALDFVETLRKNPERTSIEIKKPAIVGAVINLGNCLDFTDFKNLELLKKGYKIFQNTLKDKEIIPINRSVGGSSDLLLRELDCIVIETLHEALGLDKYDSVRGVFWEGDEVYPTAGFREKNHIQICVRNPNCIKGFFEPREADESWRVI